MNWLNEMNKAKQPKDHRDTQIELINSIRLMLWANASKFEHLPYKATFVQPSVIENLDTNQSISLSKLLKICKSLAKKLDSCDLRSVEFIVWGKFYKNPKKQFHTFLNKYKKIIKSKTAKAKKN